MSTKRTSENAFETAIEAQLLGDGHTEVDIKAASKRKICLMPSQSLSIHCC